MPIMIQNTMVKGTGGAHDASALMIRKYRIMRLLYNGPLTYNEIEAQMQDVEPRWITSAISKLLGYHDVGKENIEPQKELTTASIAKDLIGVKEKPKIRYVLLECGKKKLAYLEWKHQLYTQLPPNSLPWSDDFNQRYYDEITERIRKNNWKTA